MNVLVHLGEFLQLFDYGLLCSYQAHLLNSQAKNTAMELSFHYPGESSPLKDSAGGHFICLTTGEPLKVNSKPHYSHSKNFCGILENGSTSGISLFL